MRAFEEVKTEPEEWAALNAEPWMAAALKMNPDYVYWGPYEDYMSKEGPGWDGRVMVPSWGEFKWKLDELNECVNYYFHVERDSSECEPCAGTGYNEGTKRLSDDWYDFAKTGRRWDTALVQEEVDALVAEGRLMDLTGTWTKDGWKQNDGPGPTAADVNAWAAGKGLGHDAINRWICVKARATRLGCYGLCARCDGRGYVWTADAATLKLTLWMIHPRKGCSRGVEIQSLQRADVRPAKAWLKAAAKRNADRFSRLK